MNATGDPFARGADLVEPDEQVRGSHDVSMAGQHGAGGEQRERVLACLRKQ